MTRRESREQAVRYLFEYGAQPEKTVAQIAKDAEEQRGEKPSAFAVELLETAAAHLPEIDGRIAGASDNWRVAVCELCFLPERTPDEIAVNEALELARTYDTDKAVPFINGVLAKVIRSRE